MINRLKKTVKRTHIQQKGQVFILTLIILLAISLLLVPMTGLIATGAHTDISYNAKANEIYAADAGVQDARWLINYDRLDILPGYSPYDFDSDWNYSLPEQINNNVVNVRLQNAWIPNNASAPDAYEAEIIIEGKDNESPKVVVTSRQTEPGTLEIKIQYYREPDEDFDVESVGLWLPAGYTFDDSDIDSFFTHETSSHAGGQAITWNCYGYLFAGDPDTHQPPFPGVELGSNPLCTTISVNYTGSSSAPDAIAWVTTNLDLTYGEYPGPYCAWDADTRIFKVSGESGSTKIDSYTSRGGLRQLGAAIGGDYYATGNSLLGGNGPSPHYMHTQLYKSTFANVPTKTGSNPGIPVDAMVKAAYLYWTGWIDDVDYEENKQDYQVFSDDCADFNDWSPGSRWTINSGRFRGQGGSGANSIRTVTLAPGKAPLGGKYGATVSWKQTASGLSSGDRLYYALSKDGTNWGSDVQIFSGGSPPGTGSMTVPGDYLTDTFRIRFYFNFTSSSKYVYLDDIKIKTSSSLAYPEFDDPETIEPADEKRLVEETAKVNKVRFCGDAVTADAYQTLAPDQFDGIGDYGDTWYYTCMADVTGLVNDRIAEHEVAANGAGDYEFGHYYVNPNPGTDDYYKSPYLPSSYKFNFFDAAGVYTNYPLGSPPYPDPEDSARFPAHAGWSLIIIYSSTETLGHQIYLYDIKTPGFKFFFGFSSSGTQYYNPDFDSDENPGGTIKGFIVPDRADDDPTAGRLTCFVGEGDRGYTDDYIQIYRTGTVPPPRPETEPWKNPWNSSWASGSGMILVPGVDIDTFNIDWGILNPGDTSVQVDIPTRGSEGFTMTYMILSFRSSVTSGGTISYLIR